MNLTKQKNFLLHPNPRQPAMGVLEVKKFQVEIRDEDGKWWTSGDPFDTEKEALELTVEYIRPARIVLIEKTADRAGRD